MWRACPSLDDDKVGLAYSARKATLSPRPGAARPPEIRKHSVNPFSPQAAPPGPLLRKERNHDNILTEPGVGPINDEAE